MIKKHFIDERIQPSFKCSNCKSISSHSWRYLIKPSARVVKKDDDNSRIIKALIESSCNECKSNSFWMLFVDEHIELIYPQYFDFPEAHTDLPKKLLPTYEEAGKTLSISIGASAALSRVCLEQLLIFLGYEKGNLNEKIKNIISDNKVSSQTGQILDTIRHFGNDGAHTGKINLDEKNGIAEYILKSINDVVDELITKPKNTKKMFDLLPEGVKKSIEQRDKSSLK